MVSLLRRISQVNTDSDAMEDKEDRELHYWMETQRKRWENMQLR